MRQWTATRNWGRSFFFLALASCSESVTEPAAPDEMAPTVIIVAPAADTVSGTVVVSAAVSDNVGVASVGFAVDGIPIGDERTQPPFEGVWNTLAHANGAHSLQVVARDRRGNTSTAVRKTTVFNTGSLRVAVTVSGDGADPDGIDILLDGVKLGGVSGTGGEVDLAGIGVGVHSVFVGGLSYNCDPEGSTSVQVSTERVEAVSLSVKCMLALAQAVAFGAPPQENSPYDIFRIEGDGTGLVNLTRTPVYDDFYPAWSPDGSKIAFVSDRGDPWWDIWVMNADGSGITRLTDDPGWDHGPVWSPDGTRIAFASDRRLRQEGDLEHMEVWVMNADGSGATRITTATDETQDLPGGWSADGSHILVERHRPWTTGQSELYLASADGSDLTLLRSSAPFTNEFGPSFSPDGNWILYGVEEWNPCCNVDIVRARADGTEPGLLLDSPDYEFHPVWTRDGSAIVYARQFHFPALMILSLDGLAFPRKMFDGIAEHPTLSP